MEKSEKENYTICDQKVLNDAALSFEAKGLYAYLLGLPEDWCVIQSEVRSHSITRKVRFSKAFKDLIRYGLIIPMQKRKNNLRNQFEYFVFATTKQAKAFSVSRFSDNGKSEHEKSDVGKTVLRNPACIQETLRKETSTVQTNNIIEVKTGTNPTKTLTELKQNDLSEAEPITEHLSTVIELMPVDHQRMLGKGIENKCSDPSEPHQEKEQTDQVPYDYSFIEDEEQTVWSEQVFFVEEGEEQTAVEEKEKKPVIKNEFELPVQKNKEQNSSVRTVPLEDEAVELIAKQFPEEDRTRFRELVERYVQQRAGTAQEPIRTAKTLAVCAFNFYNGANAFQEKIIRPAVKKKKADVQLGRGVAINQALTFRAWFEEREWFEEKKNVGTKLHGSIYDAVREWCLVSGGTSARLIGICLGGVAEENVTADEKILRGAILQFLKTKFPNEN